MSNKERPVVPSPEDFDPRDDEELKERIVDDKRRFQVDQKDAELAEKYGFPSIEAMRGLEDILLVARDIGFSIVIGEDTPEERRKQKLLALRITTGLRSVLGATEEGRKTLSAWEELHPHSSVDGTIEVLEDDLRKSGF